MNRTAKCIKCLLWGSVRVCWCQRKSKNTRATRRKTWLRLSSPGKFIAFRAQWQHVCARRSDICSAIRARILRPQRWQPESIGPQQYVRMKKTDAKRNLNEWRKKKNKVQHCELIVFAQRNSKRLERERKRSGERETEMEIETKEWWEIGGFWALNGWQWCGANAPLRTHGTPYFVTHFPRAFSFDWTNASNIRLSYSRSVTIPLHAGRASRATNTRVYKILSSVFEQLSWAHAPKYVKTFQFWHVFFSSIDRYSAEMWSFKQPESE